MAEKIPNHTPYMLHQLAPERKFPQPVAITQKAGRMADGRS
jgi:hypothetical protein